MSMACAPSRHKARLTSATDLPEHVETVDRRSASVAVKISSHACRVAVGPVCRRLWYLQRQLMDSWLCAGSLGSVSSTRDAHAVVMPPIATHVVRSVVCDLLRDMKPAGRPASNPQRPKHRIPGLTIEPPNYYLQTFLRIPTAPSRTLSGSFRPHYSFVTTLILDEKRLTKWNLPIYMSVSHRI